MNQGLVVAVGAVAIIVSPAALRAQQASPEQAEPRRSAVSLQDLPRVRIEDADGASRSRVADTTKPRRPELDAYTFLSSTPGGYRRVTRITNRLSYIEQLDRTQRYLTFTGGLRVALSK